MLPALNYRLRLRYVLGMGCYAWTTSLALGLVGFKREIVRQQAPVNVIGTFTH